MHQHCRSPHPVPRPAGWVQALWFGGVLGWRHWGLALALAVTLAHWPSASFAAEQTLRVVTTDHMPPLISRDQDGRLQGLQVDRWRLWEQQTGVRVDLQGLDWAEALASFERGEADVIDGIITDCP